MNELGSYTSNGYETYNGLWAKRIEMRLSNITRDNIS